VHLVIENDENRACYLRRDEPSKSRWYDAQWNEDFHHVMHTLASGEIAGYYVDYRENTIEHFGKSLTKGFSYMGEWSGYRGRNRGEDSKGLHATAFVAFLQNHDQVGNRPMGDRITAIADRCAVRAMTEIFLLSPQPPLLFMGQEYAVDKPFPFFCDLSPELGPVVAEGRRRHFEEAPYFKELYDLDLMPDPADEETFQSAIIDLSQLNEPEHREWHALHKRLFDIRRKYIWPRIKGVTVDDAWYKVIGPKCILAGWRLNDGSGLTLLANLGPDNAPCIEVPDGVTVYTTSDNTLEEARRGVLPPWSVAWLLKGSE
jgi:malto-oligosyltrehalose trehalohydrolase